MEEFHDELDDDIVGSGFVRGSGELMVLFEDLISCQLGFQSFYSRGLPSQCISILYGIGVNICDCSKYSSNLEVFPIKTK